MGEEANSVDVKSATNLVDPYESLKIIKNPDGSITRLPTFPTVPPTPSSAAGDGDTPDAKPASLSKDVTLNEANKTCLRLFRPNRPPPPPGSPKLPLIVHFHGGGFILFSVASAPFHTFCGIVAAFLPAVVASVEYRLAPEHRLPAAYDDATEALEWIRDNIGTDDWLLEYADPGQCFLDGSSAGANIAYHAALHAQHLDLGELTIRGLILNEPYFGGAERSASELRHVDDRILPLPANDLMWELALPAGSDRDHEFCNPMGSVREPDRERIGRLPRCLVRGYGGDPLVDRQKGFVKMLEDCAVRVVVRFGEDGFHAVELFEPDKFQQLLEDVRDFVLGSPSML